MRFTQKVVKQDRKNTRTAGWALARGEFSLRLAWIIALLSVGALLLAAWQLNSLCFKLAPLAVLVLWGYSYTKRFTWWCHLILGLAIGMGPVGGWIAVSGQMDWPPFLLTLAVAFWIAGFDTMYACQDIDFDRQEGLFSIPARFGARGALYFARVFHLLSLLFFIAEGLALGMGWFYFLGIFLAAVILVYEHTLVTPDNLSLVNIAAFRVNRYVSLVVFLMTIVDVFN